MKEEIVRRSSGGKEKNLGCRRKKTLSPLPEEKRAEGREEANRFSPSLASAESSRGRSLPLPHCAPSSSRSPHRNGELPRHRPRRRGLVRQGQASFSFSFIVAPFSASTGAFFLLPSRSVQALERLSLSSRESTAFLHSIRAQKAVAALEMAFEARRQASFPFSLSFAPMLRHRSSFFSTSSASLLLPSPSSLFFALSTGALPPPQLHPAPSRSTRPDENTRAPSSPSSASPRPASPRGTSRDCAPRSTSCGGCATPGSSRCSTRSRRGTTSAW